jgi:acyl-CoA synthetase (AMP-forming)/AMP-acid ligase II
LSGPDVRWIFFTSGTSSAPKGVQHTDDSVGHASLALARGLGVQPSDRSAVAFPIAHIGGVNWTIASLLSGCQLLLAERFGPDVIDYFDRRGITLPGVVTAHHLAYRDAARARARTGRRLFTHTRAYPGGGATKPPTLLGELNEAIGGVIVSGYGLTGHPMITMASVDDPAAKLAGTEGKPSPGVRVSIRDSGTGAPVAPGADGEIWARGPHQFQGYLTPDATASVLDAEGFLRTGDLGHLDADGHIVITGRVKDVIVRKGENISAKEVEDHLYVHPEVADVAVVGLQDDKVGERCCAVLVPRGGAGELTVQGLGKFLAGRGLMRQKWPEQVVLIDTLPRNTSGKVVKSVLVDQLVGRPNNHSQS